MKYKTIKEAAQAWVAEFNAIPTEVVRKLMDMGEVTEINPPEKADDVLPMWSMMWTFSDSTDKEWAYGEYLGPHIKEMQECGFRCYEQEDFEFIFGIDGAGYDFYSEHWIPLYLKRGLKWHKEAEENDDKTA